MRTNTSRIIKTLAVAAALIFGGSAALAGECYTANVGQPIALPDGSVSVNDLVKVCRIKQLTPASTLHSLSIGGRDLGMFLGARQTVELDANAQPSPSMLFARNGSKVLEFRAVAYVVGGHYQAFRADRIGREDRVLSGAAFELAMAGEAGSMLVAVAAD